jgi:hypothetical protein
LLKLVEKSATHGDRCARSDANLAPTPRKQDGIAALPQLTTALVRHAADRNDCNIKRWKTEEMY